MGRITDRIDAITRIPPERMRAALPAHEERVKIEISPRCNYRCGFCALRVRAAQPKRDMDFGLFRRIARELREAGVEEIGVFYLGESFMSPRLLVDCIAYLKRELATPYVFLTSNASMAFPEAVEECMKAGLDSLKWSVNAADEAQFVRIMGVSGKLFRRALDDLPPLGRCAAAAATRPASTLPRSTTTASSTSACRRCFASGCCLTSTSTYRLPLYSMGSFAAQRERELGFRPTAGNQGRLGALRPPLPCWSAFTEGHVTADGKLSACCFDATAHWTMGDLTRQSFMQAWNSPPFVALREAHLRGDVRGTVCERCIAY
ncbi:MAG: radical SAM protein [Burkholderiales bacterium]|nr:radical SAM protein [Burkholderiales bacterium]